MASACTRLPSRPQPPKAEHLGLGEALRLAHRTLDAAALRKLSHDQHVGVGRPARTARALAADAGLTQCQESAIGRWAASVENSTAIVTATGERTLAR